VRVRDIDWSTWKAVDPATLVFVVKDFSILLIHKKRGLGAGKINAPGGRLEPGETPLEAAIRETREEVCVTPRELSHAGVNRFQFLDGYSIHVDVFKALDFEGEPRETGEATPLWTPVDRIPYEEMWEDDRLWVPMVLEGVRFSGRYIFDGDRMLDHEIERLDNGEGKNAKTQRLGEDARDN
jgi:8-oxo-dGTP diphosphatase